MIPSSLARAAVRNVTVRSNVTPDVEVDPFAPAPEPGPGGAPGSQVSSAGGGIGGLLLGLLQPAVYLDTPAGTIPVEPWGKPDNTRAVLVGVAATAATAGLLWLAWRGLKTLR